MEMNPLLKLTMALHLIHACLSASCTFVKAPAEPIKIINDVRNRVLKEKPFLDSYESHPDLFINDLRIKNICPKPRDIFSLKSNPPRKEYLRGNTFSAVLSVKLYRGVQAVKILSFAHFVKFKLQQDLSCQNQEDIIEEIVEVLGSMPLLSSPDEISGERLDDERLIKKNLTRFASTVFADIIIKDLDKIILSYLETYWQQIVNEVDINQKLHKTSAQLPHNIVEFIKCYIDAQLNIFIVTDNPGPALSAVKESCSGPLSGKNPLDVIARNRNLFFAVDKLHELGLNFCSAKPEHLAVSEDFDPRQVFLTDFSAAVQNGMCPRKVSVFTPPEALSKGYKQISYQPMLRPGVTMAGLFDAFNFGVLLASLELSAANFEVFSNTYENDIAKLKAEYDQGVISVKSGGMQKNFGGVLPTKKQADKAALNNSLKDKARQLRLRVEVALENNIPEIQKTNKSHKGAKIELSAEKSQFNVQSADLETLAVQIYPRLIQQLINKIITGLLVEDFKRRLSIKEALYLFNLLSVLVKPEILASTDNEKVIPALKVLQFAEVLFDEPDLLEMAVQGKFFTSEALAILIKNKITEKNEKKLALAGDFEAVNFDEDQKKLIKAHALVNHVSLPSFKQIVSELGKELLPKKEMHLI